MRTTVSLPATAWPWRPSGRPAAAADKPLSLHPDNPHYFLFRGKPTILLTSGEHYGAVLNLDFDYFPYLDELKDAHPSISRSPFRGRTAKIPPAFGIVDNMLAPQPKRFLSPGLKAIFFVCTTAA